LLKNATISEEIKRQAAKIEQIVANKVASEVKDEVKADVLTATHKADFDFEQMTKEDLERFGKYYKHKEVKE
jgi:hypothetical protein